MTDINDYVKIAESRTRDFNTASESLIDLLRALGLNEEERLKEIKDRLSDLQGEAYRLGGMDGIDVANAVNAGDI